LQESLILINTQYKPEIIKHHVYRRLIHFVNSSNIILKLKITEKNNGILVNDTVKENLRKYSDIFSLSLEFQKADKLKKHAVIKFVQYIHEVK
jgi:hypothetical protein